MLVLKVTVRYLASGVRAVRGRLESADELGLHPLHKLSGWDREGLPPQAGATSFSRAQVGAVGVALFPHAHRYDSTGGWISMLITLTLAGHGVIR